MPEQAPHATTKNPVGAAVLGPPEIPAPTKGRGNSETPVRAAVLGLPEIPAPYENMKSPVGAALRGRPGQASRRMPVTCHETLIRAIPPEILKRLLAISSAM